MLFSVKGQYILVVINVIYILMAVHIYFTVKSRFVQKYLFRGIRHTFCPNTKQSGIGTYSAFSTALGTTIGAGNITGVAVAISVGGAGSVMWMWLSGILAMSTKYAESYLALKYGEKGFGGPSVILKNIGKERLSVFWTLACAGAGLVMGSAVPSNCLAEILPVPRFVTGFILAFTVALTVSFGVRGISKLADLLVPVMTVVFLAFSLAVIFVKIKTVPLILKCIVTDAFSFSSFFGGTLGSCIKCGIERGLYSNESGLGSGGVLAAESGDSDWHMGALSAMTTVFWDTVVMCAVTGIMFLTAGNGDTAEEIMTSAFFSLPLGNIVLPLCMSLFVFASVIGWYYIVNRTLRYVFKTTAIYDIFFIISIFTGALFRGTFIWQLADGINLIMLLPSLYVLLKMSDKILYIKDN